MEILLPGERGARALRPHARDGIPLFRPIVDELRAGADHFGVVLGP